MGTAERHGGRKPGTHLVTHLDMGIDKQDGKGERSAGKANWSQIKEVLRGQEKEVELYQEENIESNDVTSGVHFRNINLAD